MYGHSPIRPAGAFPQFLDGLLRQLGLSNGQAARQLGVARSQVGRWRNGEGGISLENLERIHQVFGVDLDYLRSLVYGVPMFDAEPIDPQMAALLEAERAEMRALLGSVDREQWPAILQTRSNIARIIRDALVKDPAA